jgi:putative iron-dependent peroxidase
VPAVQPRPVLEPSTPAAIFLLVTIGGGGEAIGSLKGTPR